LAEGGVAALRIQLLKKEKVCDAGGIGDVAWRQCISFLYRRGGCMVIGVVFS
jgi:hypothetical protein